MSLPCSEPGVEPLIIPPPDGAGGKKLQQSFKLGSKLRVVL